MPSSVLYGTKRVYTPGVYTTTDSTALVTTSPESSGIVALLGESTGGVPYTAIQSRADINTYVSMAQLARDYPQGDLLEAANMAFAPSPSQPGAAAVVPLKVNPATQASITLNAASGPSLTLTANAYGLGGNTISVAIAAGQSPGSTTITLAQGDTTEASGDLQNDPVASVSYSASGSWQNLSLTVTPVALTLAGSGTFADHSAEVARQGLAAPAQVGVSCDPSDVGKTLILVGLDASGAALMESLPLSATSQQSTHTFAKLLGATLSNAALDVKASDAAGNLLIELKNNHTSAGISVLPGLAVASDVVRLGGSGAGPAVVFGRGLAGQALASAVTLAGSGQVATADKFTSITGVASGSLAGGGTVAALAGNVLCGGGTTILAAKGALSSVAGLSVDLTAGDETAPLASLDALAATPLGTSPVALVSDLEAIVDWVNGNSALVVAAPAVGAAGVPTATDQPLFFQGGTETPATAADYIAAVQLLKKVRVNVIAALTCDPAVTNALNEHCKFMWGAGESERVFHAGAQGPSLNAPASKQQMFAQQAGLNSGYAWLVPNGIIKFDTQGNLRSWQPQFAAALLAGLRAGLPLGQPMTRKPLDVIGIFHDRSWDPLEDSEDLIAHGICFMRETDNVGVSVVRDVTTWTRTDDKTKSSGSIVFNLGYATYVYRLGLQAYVGNSGSSGTDNAIVVQAITLNQRLVNLQALAGYERPTLTRVDDAVYISQEWHPTDETNFILPTLRLTRTPAAS